MMRSGCLIPIASMTELKELRVRNSVGIPPQWKKARTHHQGLDEVVEGSKGVKPDQAVVYQRCWTLDRVPPHRVHIHHGPGHDQGQTQKSDGSPVQEAPQIVLQVAAHC